VADAALIQPETWPRELSQPVEGQDGDRVPCGHTIGPDGTEVTGDEAVALVRAGRESRRGH